MKTTLSSVKKRAWNLFSQLVRLEECYETTDSPWSGICVTCNREYPYTELQAGHFLASRCNSILFERNGVHIQCKGCNLYKHGNIENYYPYMLNRYGQDEIDRLKRLKNTSKKYTIAELELLCKTFKEKLNLIK